MKVWINQNIWDIELIRLTYSINKLIYSLFDVGYLITELVIRIAIKVNHVKDLHTVQMSVLTMIDLTEIFQPILQLYGQIYLTCSR